MTSCFLFLERQKNITELERQQQLAEERAKVEELTRELKKFQGEAKHFKAAPVPTFTENSVKPTRTTLLRQQSLRIKKN